MLASGHFRLRLLSNLGASLPLHCSIRPCTSKDEHRSLHTSWGIRAGWSERLVQRPKDSNGRNHLTDEDIGTISHPVIYNAEIQPQLLVLGSNKELARTSMSPGMTRKMQLLENFKHLRRLHGYLLRLGLRGQSKSLPHILPNRQVANAACLRV